MEIHPDERARLQQLEESRCRTTSFPSYIKPWKGEPLPVKKLDPSAVCPPEQIVQTQAMTYMRLKM